MNAAKEYRPYRGRRGSAKRALIALLAVLLAAVAAFGALLGVVLAGSHDDVRGDPQVMLVLGCQVHSWGPSVLLQDRLNTALDYWEEHQELTIVVSGGQGDDEPTSEARAMADYLMERGVPEENILLEERSHNTDQNLRCSIQVLAEAGYDATGNILIVSNGFHLARVRMLWGRACGTTENLSTLAAPSSHIGARLSMYLREPLALLKSFFMDR